MTTGCEACLALRDAESFLRGREDMGQASLQLASRQRVRSVLSRGEVEQLSHCCTMQPRSAVKRSMLIALLPVVSAAHHLQAMALQSGTCLPL